MTQPSFSIDSLDDHPYLALAWISSKDVVAVHMPSSHLELMMHISDPSMCFPDRTVGCQYATLLSSRLHTFKVCDSHDDLCQFDIDSEVPWSYQSLTKLASRANGAEQDVQPTYTSHKRRKLNPSNPTITNHFRDPCVSLSNQHQRPSFYNNVSFKEPQFDNADRKQTSIEDDELYDALSVFCLDTRKNIELPNFESSVNINVVGAFIPLQFNGNHWIVLYLEYKTRVATFIESILDDNNKIGVHEIIVPSSMRKTRKQMSFAQSLQYFCMLLLPLLRERGVAVNSGQTVRECDANGQIPWHFQVMYTGLQLDDYQCAIHTILALQWIVTGLRIQPEQPILTRFIVEPGIVHNNNIHSCTTFLSNLSQSLLPDDLENQFLMQPTQQDFTYLIHEHVHNQLIWPPTSTTVPEALFRHYMHKCVDEVSLTHWMYPTCPDHKLSETVRSTFNNFSKVFQWVPFNQQTLRESKLQSISHDPPFPSDLNMFESLRATIPIEELESFSRSFSKFTSFDTPEVFELEIIQHEKCFQDSFDKLVEQKARMITLKNFTIDAVLFLICLNITNGLSNENEISEHCARLSNGGTTHMLATLILNFIDQQNNLSSRQLIRCMVNYLGLLKTSIFSFEQPMDLLLLLLMRTNSSPNDSLFSFLDCTELVKSRTLLLKRLRDMILTEQVDIGLDESESHQFIVSRVFHRIVYSNDMSLLGDHQIFAKNWILAQSAYYLTRTLTVKSSLGKETIAQHLMSRSYSQNQTNDGYFQLQQSSDIQLRFSKPNNLFAKNIAGYRTYYSDLIRYHRQK